MESKNAISSWSKEKLEDQYLRLYDDYLTLKKHACKQEERIKKMATKILRLASDKKDSDPGSVLKEDYQEQIEVLERKNATLTRKPLSARKASSATIQTTGRNSCVGEKPMNNSNVIQTLRFQNSAFEKTIQKLSGQLKERNELIDQLKEELQIKEKIHTNDLVTLGEQVTSKQRIALQENLDLIRTQRELREKQLLINHLEERIKEAESNYNIIKSTNRQLVIEIERLTRESISIVVQSDKSLLKLILLLQYAFDDAKRENQALKESNEKLIANAFSIKPEQNWTLKEQKLRGQIDHLEMMVHNLQQQLKQTEQQEKHSAVEEKIIPNRQQSNQLESIPNKQVDKVNSNDQATVTNTTTQMFAQITGFTVEELEDAIMMLRERKSKSQSVDEHLLPNSDKYLLGQNKGQLHLLPSLLYKYQTNSSPTTNNNQNNHITEESINLFLTWDFYDYETQATPILLIQNSIDLNMTIQYPIEINDTLMNYLIKEPCTIEMHQVINSNYRTIAVGKLNFTQLFTGKDDSIEIPDQGSIVRRQGQLDLFLISTPNNSINIKENEKIKFGTLDYWIRLTAPMLDSIKLYKERFQQLPGSISFTNKSSIHHEELHSTDLSKNILTIEIMKITNLIQQRLNYLPSIYFVYQFYNELEYASMIIKQNNTPIFNDLHTIQLEMNDELDNYLKTQNLNIYIVDSTDPSPETSCLGLAIIPLIGLINKNQKIDGIFEIFPLTTLKKRQQSNQINKNQSNCGLLYLKMYWQRPYTVTTTTTTTNSRNTVVYNQPNMEESKDLEMEPVKQAAEKPYITQYESSKEACLQPKSSSNVSFAKPIDKLNPSDNLPNNSTRKKQDTPDLDQVIVKVPELTVNKTDNQIPNPSDDNPKINTKTNEMLSSSSPSIQSQLEDSGKQSIVPTPHPRTKTSEPQNLKIDLLNQSITSKKTISKTNQDPEPSSSIFTDENHVKIELHGLQLINLSKLLKSNQTLPCQIFIEYSFLGYKEPFETSTYPLIEWIDNNKNILKSNFYYTKTFPVDFTENYERRQYLASYLLPEDPNNGNIIFIIVSEPSTSTTTQSAECEEIGYAMINIRQIIQDNCDIDHVFIPITAAKAVDGETESLNEIGRLCVSFYGLSALHAIIAEMPQVKLAI
ncbi:rpgr-interacting protein 1 related [Schistosoma mansoni]|uniref:rpgr-interacting protein 1 related n=1 Tax=Schistosoma mansoni TaxID=6183 RepID=UPI00022DC2E4|nr:rpgr-interacting protein 1 related [Schistosoma mansoni]|eukprot:XP_018652871.1 rpgr-interacting protein 1 related [Schistosoma mansoni]